MRYLILFLISFNVHAGLDDCFNDLTGGAISLCGAENYNKIKAKMAQADKGRLIIAIMRQKNEDKNLRVGQKKIYFNQVKDIMAAIDKGSFDIALDLANSINPDGTIITEADKASLIQMLE